MSFPFIPKETLKVENQWNQRMCKIFITSFYANISATVMCMLQRFCMKYINVLNLRHCAKVIQLSVILEPQKSRRLILGKAIILMVYLIPRWKPLCKGWYRSQIQEFLFSQRDIQRILLCTKFRKIHKKYFRLLVVLHSRCYVIVSN